VGTDKKGEDTMKGTHCKARGVVVKKEDGHTESGLRVFLWDNPELRRAFSEAKEKEDRKKGPK